MVLSAGRSEDSLPVVPRLGAGCMMVSSVVVTSPTGVTASARRAEELATDGDHAGAAIWRRVTVAIEQLTDTTGPPH